MMSQELVAMYSDSVITEIIVKNVLQGSEVSIYLTIYQSIIFLSTAYNKICFL